MSEAAQPTLTVIGGPNGSGKSTLTRSLLTASHVPIVDPDAIARSMQPEAPEQAAIPAGREALRRQHAYLAQGVSFVVETTLAGAMALRLMEEARQHGFTVHLMFIGINDVVTNIERVSLRVAQGGHHVPDEDVRRRYMRSMENLAPAIERADQAIIFDNSTREGPIEVLAIDAGRIVAQASDLPAWLTTALGAFLTSRPDRP